MSFLTPLGLLGLIGVLLLILIYVLKPKYQEKVISSTFIWKLSLKYKKQKMPFQWLKSSLLVILQFLILLLITLALTSPLVALNTQSGEKIVILDVSANMLAESGGRTRFERAVQEIGALADSTTPDDRFTVILAGQEASFVARRLDSAIFIKQLLSELSATYVSADIGAAVKLTEGVLAENPNAEVILFTGNSYSETGTIRVRDMSRDEWNVSVLDLSAQIDSGYYTITAEVASFNRDANIDVNLYIDDELRDTKNIDLTINSVGEITWDDLLLLNYSKIEVVLSVEDDFPYDNQFAIYGWENERFSVQIVSESPRFLQAAFLTLGNYTIHIPVAPEEGAPLPIAYEGFDLYIFDAVEPEYLPIDGSVWLINPPSLPDDVNLTLGGKLSGDFTLSSSNDLSEPEQAILNFVRPSEITLSEYTFISDFDSFDPILFNDSDPIILATDLDGQKLVVFAFSLHQSNLPIIPDYIALTFNLARYSVQNMVERYLFHSGDTVHIRKKSSALQMILTSDSEEVLYEVFPISYIADKPGSYTVTQLLASGEEVSVEYFVRIAKNQSNFDYDHGILLSPVTPNTADVDDVNQDTLDIIYYIVGLLIILMLIEWGLHYREHN
jgi:Ca-activated chloride channel homolog